MISALDTSVLLDVFAADPVHMRRSLAALRRAAGEGELIACEIVWSEVSAFFPSSMAARDALETIQVRFAPMDADAALTAGAMWGDYRRGGGKRTRIVADFLIGAHAASHADRLVTRDRGFYRSYFGSLVIMDPGQE